MNKGYFPSFYSDIDELHRLTEKYRFSYVLGQWQAACLEYAEAVGKWASAAMELKLSAERVIDAASVRDLPSE